MNRSTRRLLEKKLGTDFPLDKFIALYSYYNNVMNLDVNEFMIYLLKRYIPLLYIENHDLIDTAITAEIDSLGGDSDEKE